MRKFESQLEVPILLRCTAANMNCPECAELKATYDKCLKDYISGRVMKWDVSVFTDSDSNKCEKAFEVHEPVKAPACQNTIFTIVGFPDLTHRTIKDVWRLR
jgi:hypothetical protein